MSNAFFEVPVAVNEPVLSYAPGSPERAELKNTIANMKSMETEVRMYIGGEWVASGNKIPIHPPHELKHTLGYYHKGSAEHVSQAIDAAMAAKPAWENMPWQERAAIFSAETFSLGSAAQSFQSVEGNALHQSCITSSKRHQASTEKACETLLCESSHI